jgi:hypothetical protein
MMIVQAGVGFGMKWLRAILYHRTALWLAQAGGVVALALPWAFPGYPVFLVAFPLVGVYLGFVFFCAVYYASNDFAHRSRNVGINECLVGAGSLLGIFTSETWMTWGADQSLIYPACAGALAVLTAVQVVIAPKNGCPRGTPP